MSSIKDRPDKRQNFYTDDATMREMRKEAKRLDRSLSWLIRTAWALSYDQIRELEDAPARRKKR